MFQLLAKLANHSSNKTNPNLQSLRIFGERVISTNLTTVAEFYSPFTKDLDCLVPASDFMEAYNLCSSPTFSQQGNRTLVISEGKFKAEINLLDTREFVIGVEPKEESEGLPAQELVEAIKAISKSLKTDSFQIIVKDGHIYSTDGAMIIRRPLNLDIAPFALSKSLVDLVSAITDEPKSFHLTPNSIKLHFDTSSVESTRNTAAEALDCSGLFEGFEKLSMQTFEPEFLEQLKKLIAIASEKEGSVTFNSEGVSVRKGSKSSMSLAGSFEKRTFNPTKLQIALLYADSLNLNDPHKMAFAGKGFEGFLAPIVTK